MYTDSSSEMSEVSESLDVLEALEAPETKDWESMLGQEIISLGADYPEEAKNALLNALASEAQPSMRGLVLGCNPLTPADLASVVTIVEHANHLVYLDISDCDIGAAHLEATRHLSQAIAKHPKLRSLSLSNNHFTTESVECLEAIMLNGTLLKLDLSFSPFIDASIGPLLLKNLQDLRSKIVSLNLVVTPLVNDHTLDKAISAQLNMNIAGLLEHSDDWRQIDIPASILTFLKRTQSNCFDRTEIEYMRVHPLIYLKERQLAYEASDAGLPILPAYALRQAQPSTASEQDEAPQEKDASKKDFKKL
jgi:Leucine Rich repeat